MKSRGSKRAGKFFFLLPVVIVLALAIIGFVGVTGTPSGMLVVGAVTSGRYSPSVELHVSVTIGATTRTTPFNFSLPQGGYDVVYGKSSWYVTPPSRSVQVLSGKTQYAVAVYSPVVVAVDITANGFNSTSVSSLHGVTPVSWINRQGSPVVLVITGVDSVQLSPLQNYTTVFSGTGTFRFYIANTNFNGVVNSK